MTRKPRGPSKNGASDGGRTLKPPIRIIAKTTVMALTGEGLEGGEVEVVADASMATFLELKRLVTEEQGELLGRTFGNRILVGWNLVDEDDKPLPPTGDGMDELPASMALSIVTDWFETLETVSAPLGDASSDGETLEELSIVELGSRSQSLPN